MNDQKVYLLTLFFHQADSRLAKIKDAVSKVSNGDFITIDYCKTSAAFLYATDRRDQRELIRAIDDGIMAEDRTLRIEINPGSIRGFGLQSSAIGWIQRHRLADQTQP